MQLTQSDFDNLQAQLAQMSAMLARAAPGPQKHSYDVDEVAEMFGKARYTVREWCRLGQCHAFKLRWGRSGRYEPWRLTAQEIERIRTGGLLPIDTGRNLGKLGRI